MQAERRRRYLAARRGLTAARAAEPTLAPMGARSIPPPPAGDPAGAARGCGPSSGWSSPGSRCRSSWLGAFMVVVDRRARLFRASCLAVVLMWVDIRMLVRLLGPVGAQPRPLLADLARGP